MSSEKISLSRRNMVWGGVALCAAASMGLVPTPAMSKGNVSMNERPELAASRFGPMSCSQALATAYADLVGLDEERAKKLGAAFGLGMGRKLTCGAVTVMLMLTGLAGKGEICPRLMDEFEKRNGSIKCAYFVDQFGFSRCPDLLRSAGTLMNQNVFV